MKPDTNPEDVPPRTGAAELGDILAGELRSFVEGAAEDLRTVAARIVADATIAAASGRADLIQECRDNARTLAEAHRLRASSSQWRVFDAIVGTLVRTLAVGRVA